MAMRKKLSPKERGFISFDVVYSDGSRASNRRVPAELLGGLDGDAPARDYIQEQDAEIARKSGRDQRLIESLFRSAARAPTQL
jgi:hypothetical protein